MKRAPEELLRERPCLIGEDVPHPSTGDYLGPPPPKYTIAVHERIVEELKKGQLVQGACARAGITTAMFYDWIKKGKAGDPHLHGFAEDVEIAYNTAEADALEAVTEAYKAGDPAVRDIENAKWYLERTRSGRFSKQVKTTVENQIQQFMMRLEAALEPHVFEQVLAVYLGQSPGLALPSHDDGTE